MSLSKYASFTVLAAKVASNGAPLMRTAHRHEFQYEPREGFLYVRSRAISSRTNDNFDNFPAEEIKTAYRTFIGKPVFVNHVNDNHRRARGVIKDAVLHEDVNPDGSPDTWVEVLMEVDAVRFPKLAQAIIAGEIDRTSMGTDVAYSLCSFCGNKAASPVDYCKHIPRMKGRRIYRTTASGAKEGVLVYEICHGLGFFENSLLVEEPADPTAYFLGVDARGVGGEMTRAASLSTEAMTHEYDLTLACGCSVRYVGSQPDQVTIGQSWTCPTHGPTTVADATGQGMTYRGLGWDHHGSKTASRKTALDETPAPAAVDTLRDETCPVCGEGDAFDGEKCQVCNFVAPPDEFMEPDLQKAKQTDLRQDKTDDAIKGGGLVCPNCNASFPGTPAEPKKALLDRDKAPADDPAKPNDAAVETAPQVGDPCPECGEGTLELAPDADPAAALAEDGVGSTEEFLPAGSANDQQEDDADDADGPDGPDAQDGEDGKKPPFVKKKPTAVRSGSTQKENSMRPALAALAAQQKQIDGLKAAVAFIADVAGISEHPKVTAALKATAVDDNPAFGGGWENMKPVEAPPEAPAATTEEARTPAATTPVDTQGGTTLSDVSADATTSVTETTTVLPVTLDLNEEDVTAPVAGTDNLGKGDAGSPGTNRIETDVRAGTPSDGSAAFRDGGFLGSVGEGRVIASLRLARLQIQAGLESREDVDLMQAIASSDISDEMIQDRINTLESLAKATAAPTRPVARNLVPRAASGAQRTVPSLSSEGSVQAPAIDIIGSAAPEAFAFE